MSIQAIRKTGFLIEDGALMGDVIGYLRAMALSHGGVAETLAFRLDAIRARSYYEPLQPKLIVDEIGEVA